jgi:hypothetical protein
MNEIIEKTCRKQNKRPLVFQLIKQTKLTHFYKITILMVWV